jgi:hypothetical protein
MLPVLQAESVSSAISPRRRGVKQGAFLLLLGAIIVPTMGVLYGFTDFNVFQFLAALAAVLLFIGGPLRMLYAALFEEGAPRRVFPAPQGSYVPVLQAPQAAQSRINVLPPAAANPTAGWRRPNTAELVNPPSVTEHTTRLLDQKIDREPEQ